MGPFNTQQIIKMFNGKNFGKRPIAVDWAVSKKVYASGGKSLDAGEEGNFRFSNKIFICAVCKMIIELSIVLQFVEQLEWSLPSFE